MVRRVSVLRFLPTDLNPLIPALRLNSPIRALDLARLKAGFPAITPSFGASLAEAAVICLDEQGHSSGVVMTVDGETFGSYSVIFQKPTDQMVRCWNDEEVTTEHGVYGIAIFACYRPD